jgi:hypothetical protein
MHQVIRCVLLGALALPATGCTSIQDQPRQPPPLVRPGSGPVILVPPSR